MPTTLNNITVRYEDTEIFRADTGELSDNARELTITVAPNHWNLVQYQRANYGHNNNHDFRVTGTRELGRVRNRGDNLQNFDQVMKIAHWQLVPPLFRFTT